MDAKARIGAYLRRAVPGDIGDEDDIFELGLVDSLFAMQLVTFVESAFSIAVERDDLDIANFCSISALAAFVEAKSGTAGPQDAGHGHRPD